MSLLCHPFRLGFLSATTAVLLTACGTSQQAADPTATAVAARSTVPDVIVASSDLAVGKNRFTFGVLDNNHPLSTGRPKLTFISLKGTSGIVEGTTTANFNHFSRGLRNSEQNSAAVEIGGVYVAHAYFRKPGKWGVVVRMPVRGRMQSLQTVFDVKPRSVSPAVGSPAPRSNNPTTAQLPLSKLDSNKPPTTMHKISIAKALAEHRPLVVLFATGGYCTSRMCGPEIEVVEKLHRKYGKRANFVHIEIYKNARPPTEAPTFRQWHLQTEPWVFVINRKGNIIAKFEGPTTGAEIEPSIRSTLS